MRTAIQVSCLRHLTTFGRARGGNIMMTFAFALIALLGMVGLAVDYGRMTKVRLSLQTALDNGMLAAATRKSLNQDDAATFLDAYMKENWKKPFGSSKPDVVMTSAGKNGLSGTATTVIPMTFMNVVGIKSSMISASARSGFGLKNTEVAMVLDTTGSMAGSKLTDLQSAAKSLITAAYTDPEAKDKIKFAIAPFADYVNVGMSYRTASWMSVPADYSVTDPNVCTTTKPLLSKSGCTTTTAYWNNDGTIVPYTTETCTSYIYGPETTTCGPQTTDYKWYGCVGSRAYPLDTTQARADGTQKVPGLMNTGCNSPIQRLTNDKAKLFSSIDSFVAQAETYVAAGLIWGWRLVSHEAPFADGVNPASGTPVRKVIVLMTDGTNTRSPTYPEHWGGDTALANTLTKELCNSVKAGKVEIYAIAFGVTDPVALDLIKTCASSPPYFFDAKNTSDLMASFQAIGSSLSVVSLTR
jgi:Flp pilus assembly protein TadG